MTTIQGSVTQVRQETKTSNKTGKPFQIHYTQVTGDDGVPVEVNMGFNQMYQQGQSVNIPVKVGYGGKGWDFDKDGSGGGQAPTQASQAAPQGTNPPAPRGKTFPLAADHADNVIVRQNALAHATAIYTASHSQEALASQSNEERVEQVVAIAMGLVVWATGRADLAAVTGESKSSVNLS